MQPLVERAAAVLNRVGSAAVPLADLVRLLRDDGVAVSDSVLTRALNAEPGRFRVIEPWRALRAAGRPVNGRWGEVTWVVPASAPAPNGTLDRKPALRRLRATLVALAWE